MRVATLALSLLLSAPLWAQSPAPAKPVAETPPAVQALDQGRTEAIVRAYDAAESWSLQAIVLLSLGTDFHPAGASIVLRALRDKDARLRPHAVELLRRMEPEAAARVALPELVGELIDNTLRDKSALLQQRTLEVLARMLPDAGAEDRAGWRKWWSAAQKTYAPPAWRAPKAVEAEERGRSVAGSIVERAFDLRDAGLDVAIVIDSTGSMQVAIDAARDAIDDVVALLSGIAPKLRLGLVHYKDFDDFGDGAQLLVPMSKNQDAVRERLARLAASGGGDVPERVEKGIEFALGDEMRWNKEANRLILVIGDAPPHPESRAELLRLVKRAHDDPFARAKHPTTGPKQPLRPFITSTIATSKEAKADFDEIAKAGGGTSVLLEIGETRAAPGAKPGAGDDGGSAVRKVVEHIMLLSFGQQHRAQLELFVRTFFEYRDA